MLWLLLPGTGLFAQVLEQRVTVYFADAAVSEVLASISRSYGTRFAFSSDMVPVHRRVTIEVQNEPLYKVLDRLFENQPVQYAALNGQVVLKPERPRKPEPVGILLETPKIKPPVQTSPLYPPQELSKEEMAALERQKARWAQVAALEQWRARRLERPVELVQAPPQEPVQTTVAEPAHRLAQISLLPLIGTNALHSARISNDFSLNVLWGISAGISGVEIGGIGNTVVGDVTGVQIAGIGSIAGGQVTGTQIAGLFNISEGQTQGFQAAGLFNLSGATDAVQAAGVFNIARGRMAGLQAAGVFNLSAEAANGAQLAGLFNRCGGHARLQLASLFNIAGDVRHAQVAALFNRAKRVQGFQLGLVNIADTVAGAPIGLINIIRRGYNRIELAHTDLFYGNIGLKFGAYNFYNIVQAGALWDSWSNHRIQGLSWGIGYGIGSVRQIAPRILASAELTAMHVNEKARWTPALNLLNQFRLGIDLQLAPHFSIFGGPSLNLMLSRRTDPDTGLAGSSLPPNGFWQGRLGAAHANAWVGFALGIRI